MVAVLEVKKFMGEVSSYKDMKLEDLIKDYSDELDEHRSWLKPFGWQRLTKWEKLLQNNAEAAICEAATRKLLSDCRIKVKAQEDISKGGPDFLCVKNNKRFYVEATCITKETATKKTGLSDTLPGTSKVQRFALLTKRIFYEIRSKTTQCSNLGAPCVIAICTLHFQAGCRCFNKHAAEQLLTGTSFITAPINTQTGQAMREPYEATDLQDSVFIRPVKISPNEIEYARSPISAFLLCPFGSLPTKVIGVLHPNPNHSFDRTLLPKIEFCRLAEGYQIGQFKAEWI